MRRLPLIVTAGLCLVAACLGLLAGLNATPREGDVIEAAARAYVAETGGTAEECVGLPGKGAIWIVVRCGAGAEAEVYRFDRSGGLIADRGEFDA